MFVGILLSSLSFSQSYNYSYTTGSLGTTYSWIDCSTSNGGTEIADSEWLQEDGLGDKKDDGYAIITWPFNFQFYDSYYFSGENLYVCTNGFIRFDDIPNDDATDTYKNSISSYNPNLGEIVSLAMEDCGVENDKSHVYYKTTGSSPNRVFTISMDSLEIRFDKSKYTDVQVSFYETSNKVVLKFKEENISVSAYMGIHSGNSSYKNQWQDINGATPNRWRAYTPPSKSSPTLTVTQASTDDIFPSSDNEILRIQVDISGGGGAFNLTSLKVTANNTSNSDVGSVRLYHTSDTVFSTDYQIGSDVTISGGKYSFTGISYDMPGGTSYLWITYDINSSASNGNTVDGYIAANDITLDGSTYPASNQNPSGDREVSYLKWDGSSSTYWNVSANWSNNTIPTSSDNVIIPSAPTNQPVLRTSHNGYCNNLEIQSGATLTVKNSDKNLRVYGNIENEGTLNVTGTYNILLFGADNEISGSGNFSTARFRLRGSGVKYQLKTDLSITKFVIDGSSELDVNDKDLVCSGMFNAKSSSTIVVTTGSISVGGSVTLDGTFTPGTGTFYYSGSNSQSIVNKDYYNLKVRLSSGTRNLNNVSSNFRNLELVNLSTSTGTANLSADLNFDGNITVGNYCVLDLNGNDINIVKNWYNNGNVTLGSNTVIFDGIGSSHIYGNTSFYNLTVNKSTGDVYCENTTHVTDTLALTNGVVFTTVSSPLIVDAGASTTGGSENSYVDGPLRKDGTSAYTFHVGDFRRYAPIAISAPSSSTQFTAHYHENVHSNSNSFDSPLEKVSQKEYWDLDRAGSSSSVNVTLYWEDGTFSGIQTLSDLRVAHYNGSDWENKGNDATTGDASSGTITVNNISNFSPFTFGTIDADNNTLPVELTSFDLIKVDAEAMLKWITSSEINNDYFSVERSLNGENVETIAIVKGAGNSNVQRSYSFIDKNPPTGIVYYRIRQTDFDGKTEVFNWKSLYFGMNNKFELHPNPTSNGKVNLLFGDYQGRGIVKIYDLQGRMIFSRMLDFINGQALINIDLINGYYLISSEIDNQIFTKKLIVK